MIVSNLFMNKKLLFNSKYIKSVYDRLQKNSIKRKLFALYIYSFGSIVNLLPFHPKEFDECVFPSVRLRELLNIISRLKGKDFELVLLVWAGDNKRKRRYLWVKDDKGNLYFLKVGQGINNRKRLSEESDTSLLISSHFDQYHEFEVVLCEFFKVNDNLSFTFANCLVELNAISKHKTWQEIESYFIDYRNKTMKSIKFRIDTFNWLNIKEINQYAYIYLVAQQQEELLVSLCFNHGDLGSENILYSDKIYLIDLECTASDLPFLVDPIGVFLDSRCVKKTKNIWTEFSEFSELDIVLALCYLASNAFPPALIELDKRFT